VAEECCGSLAVMMQMYSRCCCVYEESPAPGLGNAVGISHHWRTTAAAGNLRTRSVEEVVVQEQTRYCGGIVGSSMPEAVEMPYDVGRGAHCSDSPYY